MELHRLVAGVVVLCLVTRCCVAAEKDPHAPPDPAAAPSPKWIWGPQPAQPNEVRYFRVSFDPGFDKTLKTEDPPSAWIWAACDNGMTLWLNGKLVANHYGHDRAVVVDIRPMLVPGKNVIAVKCTNEDGPAALAVKLVIRRQERPEFQLVSDERWKTFSYEPQGWRARGFDDSTWASARVLGNYGMEPYGQLRSMPPSQATPVENLKLLPGFNAELVYSVPRNIEGSWVSMTPDPKGRLYVSDQAGPLFRVTPGGNGTETQVEPVDLEIGHAQGLLWAFDSLYVVVNSRSAKNPSGLYRLRDTDGDDKLDQISLLKPFMDRTLSGPGHGEHGPHAVVLGPDNMLYLVAGNFTDVPESVAATSAARNWAEDILHPRMTDGRGHDPTIMAPGSWVARTDPDGKTWELLSIGLRNAYDIAFNPLGELFTFDSDMEWDIGTPWYRPTRIYHLVSGAEIGWRNGSGKWPAYYPDAIPPAIDMGYGSPTGVTFGTGAKFPAKYQRAFFASDWAYGTIHAVHFEPRGASYVATSEPFIVGRPFAVTDMIINHDGAMYITIGGRGTQSGLYRITYEGDEPTDPAPVVEDETFRAARALRQELERYHGRRDPAALDIAWPNLASEDRFIRYAARVAVESQDPATWAERALNETSPTAAINALVALCRTGDPSLQPHVIDALARLDPARLSEEQLLEALRVYGLCFLRMGRPDAALASPIRARLEPMFPHASRDVTYELAQLLIHLESPEVVAKSLVLLEAAQTQEDQLFYVFHLRTVKHGWTLPHRETYFAWLNRAQQNYTGGASFKLFLQKIRQDAIETLDEQEKIALAPLLKPPIIPVADSLAAVPARSFVRNWTMQDLLPRLDQLESGRSFERGRIAFAAVSCQQCHVFNGEGGGSGPDLTGVGSRFQPADLLEAIVLPSKVISDQYQATHIVTRDKNVHVGTIEAENDEHVVIRPSPFSTHTETVRKSEIASRRPSSLSIMPEGLIDVLDEEEVLDLLAYLRSGGNSHDKAFQPAPSQPAASAAPDAR